MLGLDTKMKQIAALKLTLWSQWISYDPAGVQTKYFAAPQPQPQNGWSVPGTGASTGSDLNGGAITIACSQLNAWIAQQLAHTAVWAAYLKQGSRWFVPAVYNSTGVLVKAQSDLWPEAAAILSSLNALPKQTAPAFYYSPNLTQVTTEPGQTHAGSPFYVSPLSATIAQLTRTPQHVPAQRSAAADQFLFPLSYICFFDFSSHCFLRVSISTMRRQLFSV
jgi:xanthine dehydrogenase molybdopterin-binding subunit B